MGACNFITFGKGEFARQAFDALVEEAVYEHGHDPYNGTISTTRMNGKPRKVAGIWSEEARDKAYEAAEADGWGEKWEARPLDCGMTEDGLRMFAFYGWAAC